jgi:hypothetical protein
MTADPQPAPKETGSEVAKPTVQAQTLAPASSAPPQHAAQSDPVKERLLALVVEKTGYPEDMLDLDLDLEADLGVDTVKQAELFGHSRDLRHPRDENRKLRDYQRWRT